MENEQKSVRQSFDSLPRDYQKTVRQSFNGLPDIPKEEWIRKDCPNCKGKVIASAYFTGFGYLVILECYEGLKNKTCNYKLVI